MPISLPRLNLQTICHDLLALLYPEECQACAGELAQSEHLICSQCRIKLPYTDFHLSPADNALHRVLWGRVPVRLAVAYLKFQEKGRVQRLLHNLKYKGQQEIGEQLGKWFGGRLGQQEAFSTVDGVVPVPLHKSKLQQRGYNQVSGYAKAIAEALHVPCLEGVLLKKKSIGTQTHKNRQERWEAMRSLYSVADASSVQGKHLLLVDDVITTGATLEACAQALLEAGASHISIATIAYTL